MPRNATTAWLLLIHQLPAKPAYARVKVWRRLQALGAVTVKGAVYALPANAETQEDFAWLAKEIVESGGEAMICEAALVEGLSDHEMQGLFDQARDEDYARIAAEARGWSVYWYDRERVFSDAAEALDGEDIHAFLRAMGQSVGPPWQAKQKLAAAAALAARARR